MKKTRRMLPYWIVVILTFYLLPFLINDTGSAMLILLIVVPVMCLIVSLIYGLKNLFDWLFPLLVMLLFVPSIFIFYNESASIYIPTYGIISLIGIFLGSLLKKINN